MSAAGIYGELWSPREKIADVLIIGARVPRLHHSNGIPVYQVVDHPKGSLLALHNGDEARLLAYPSDWPAPGSSGEGRYIYAKHERLPWHGPVLCFDTPLDS